MTSLFRFLLLFPKIPPLLAYKTTALGGTVNATLPKKLSSFFESREVLGKRRSSVVQGYLGFDLNILGIDLRWGNGGGFRLGRVPAGTTDRLSIGGRRRRLILVNPQPHSLKDLIFFLVFFKRFHLWLFSGHLIGWLVD